jgi:hypothetical protein
MLFTFQHDVAPQVSKFCDDRTVAEFVRDSGSYIVERRAIGSVTGICCNADKAWSGEIGVPVFNTTVTCGAPLGKGFDSC